MNTDADMELREWLAARAIPSLPYVDRKARLRAAPCFVPSRRMKAIRNAAAGVCRVYDELCDILARDPSHLKEFFSLTPVQEMLWYASGSLWHGIARADVFCTTDGSVAVAEINSDTPSGADEAWLLGEFAESRFPGYLNPNRGFRRAFLSVIQGAYAGLSSLDTSPTAAIVYPTDIPEDQGMITLYQAWLEEAGFAVLTGSPSNIGPGEDGRATLFGRGIDILYRHYKTDWWSERVNVWKDAREIPDTAPLLRELECVIGPMARRRLAVVNPFGAVVTQNKMSLAFFHEHLPLFSRESRETIQKYIPLTRRVATFEPGTLECEKDDWVLKSDYGCEGAEVIVGRLTAADAWRNALDLAEPSHWIAQQYFQAEVQDSGLIENYGVYIAGGEPSGLYIRLSRGVTGTTAVVAPALEREPLAGAGYHAAHASAGTGSAVHPCNETVRGLLRAYAPGNRWLPFRMPLILRSASDADISLPFEETPAVRAASEAGTALSVLIAGAGEELRRSVLIIADLAGPESVAMGAHAARQADVVTQVENVAHERESVPLRRTLGALLHFAPVVERGHRAGGESRPGIFILERRRLDGLTDEAAQFNNRHWAYLPTIRALESLGVDTILYVCPEGEIENDDLNEDFVQYAAGGIRICHATADRIREFRGGGLDGLLRASETTPLRRRTVFTYMLPPGDGGKSFSYNQEAVES